MQHPRLIVGQLGILLVCLLLPAVRARAVDGCSPIWTPAELAKEAKRLDRQIVCVRALLRPLPIRDRSSISLFVYEAVPLDAKQRQLDANRIGLVDWDKELGIDESLNRTESEGLLEMAANRCPVVPKDELSFDAVFRAVVEYRRALTERAYAALPPNLSAEKPLRTHYDTELVFLEFLKVTAICRRIGLLYGTSPYGNTIVSDIPDKPGYTTSATTRVSSLKAVDIGYGATQLVNATVLITINDLRGNFVDGNVNESAATLLHELGHAYYDLASLGGSRITPDHDPDPAAEVAKSQANQALVKKNCF